MTIRPASPADLSALQALYPAAFPDEDLVPLVSALSAEAGGVLSLVAGDGSKVTGSAFFTTCNVSGCECRAALLGPVAVAPGSQQSGLGSVLIAAGIERLREDGVAAVCVLGDPAYYSRFGFQPESAIRPPYALPDEWAGAWQSRRLDDGAARCEGVLQVPLPWQEPALWGP